MDQEELLMAIETMKKEKAERKEINAFIMMERHKLSDKEIECISIYIKMTGDKRPAVVKLPNGRSVKLNWEGIN